MERRGDIVILGGGVIGLSIAYYASKLNLGRILIVEKNKVGRGASSRNLGGIREQFSNEPMIRLAHYSIGIWEKLPEELRWNLLFDQKGYLIIARSEKQLEQLKYNVSLQNRLGVKSKLLSPEQVLEMIPFVQAPDLFGGSYNHRDGTAHHDAVLWAFERAVRRNHVEILEDTECNSIIATGGKAVGVNTSAGEIKAGKIVNATGVYSKDLAKTVGLELPIKSFRRETLVTEPYKHFLKPVFWDLSLGLMMSQTLRGEVLCDTRDPGVNESREIEASYEFARKLAREMLLLFPSLMNIHILRQWAGQYDVTPDGSPILGEVHAIENLYLASGYSGHGFMISPAVGKLFAELFSTGKSPDLFRPFRFNRFAEGELILEPLVAGRKIS